MQDLSLHKIKSSSIVEQIIDALTTAIINQDLRPGDKIPTETELMELLGVGRNSIREAIKMLISYGVLEIRRAEGTFIKQGFSGIMLNPLLYGVILSSSSSSQTALMEVRELIETGLLKLARQKISEKDKRYLNHQFSSLVHALEGKETDVGVIFQADNLFHESISSVCQSPIIDSMNITVRKLTEKLRLDTVTKMVREGKQGDFIDAHRNLMEYLLNDSIDCDIDLLVRKSYLYDM